jgi:hypothetical protein
MVSSTLITREEMMGMKIVTGPRWTIKSPGNWPSRSNPGNRGACSGQDETGNEEKSADAGEVTHGTPSLLLDAIVDPRRDAKDDHEQGGEEHDDDDQGDNREAALD